MPWNKSLDAVKDEIRNRQEGQRRRNPRHEGYCVEYCTEYDGDSHGGLDGESVKYQRRYFETQSRAETWAHLIRCMEPCPVAMGDIAIHDAIWEKSDGKWNIADDKNTQWIDTKTGEKY